MSDTDEKTASLLSILSKVHYVIQKYIRKKEKLVDLVVPVLHVGLVVPVHLVGLVVPVHHAGGPCCPCAPGGLVVPVHLVGLVVP